MMKKVLLLNIVLLSLFILWCNDNKTTEIVVTEWAVVRNVKRGMTQDEVIKAEWLNLENIKKEESWSISIFWTTDYINNKQLELGYFFINNSLERVVYLLNDAKFVDYVSFRKELWKKYGTWDISDEVCNTNNSPLDRITWEMREVSNSNLNSKDKLTKLERLKAEAEEWKTTFKTCLFHDDIIWDQWDLKEDDALTLWDISFFHKWEIENWTNVYIILWKWINPAGYWVQMAISYESAKYKESVKDKQRENIEHKL